MKKASGWGTCYCVIILGIYFMLRLLHVDCLLPLWIIVLVLAGLLLFVDGGTLSTLFWITGQHQYPLSNGIH